MIPTRDLAVTVFFKVGYHMSTGKNAAENYMQGKNQFARFRILQTKEVEHVIIIIFMLFIAW